MKSVIEGLIVEEGEELLVFPLLMIDKEDNLVVLVTERNGGCYKGIILHKGTNPSHNLDLQVGSFNGSLGSSYFEPFTECLRLSND